jgi:hypothetical protein
VNRSDLEELHYITPIANIPSIMRRGILCKNRANPLNPVSIAMNEIQQKRANKAVPGGLQIHDYANLYFCARNPMMYKRSARHAEICVLRIDTSVLDLKGVVIADSNAASNYTGFWPSPMGLIKVHGPWVFADDWTDANQITRWQKTAAKCAEVLVPTAVSNDRITGAYVSCPESQQTLRGVGFDKKITIDLHLFFRG